MTDHDCCLCGLPYQRLGNSPSPLAREGRCCDPCDQVVTEARIDPAGLMAELERVEDAMLRMGPDQLRQAALAAICASRGPVLWARRLHERAQLMEMIEREERQ
jgi:hypothetical protein